MVNMEWLMVNIISFHVSNSARQRQHLASFCKYIALTKLCVFHRIDLYPQSYCIYNIRNAIIYDEQ